MTDETIIRSRDEVVEAVRALSSATLHEAAGKIGALPPSLKPLDTANQICGRAFTVKCPPGDNLLLHHAIYQAGPGDVLVVDTGGGSAFGYWGEIMTAAAQSRGIAGLVITGGVRDSLKMIEMGFPVFCLGTCIRGTAKDPAGGGSLGQPITIGGISINAGDIVFGDADGLVVLPSGKALEAAKKGRGRDEAEADILKRIARGDTTLSIYNLPELEASAQPCAGPRRSIFVEGLSHGHLPIPVASRKGHLISTGGVRGVDPETGKMPDDLDEQARLMFRNLRGVIEAAGANCEDILKVTVWGSNPAARAAVNGPWSEMFPEEASRPSRHFLTQSLPGDMLVQCEALAVVE